MKKGIIVGILAIAAAIGIYGVAAAWDAGVQLGGDVRFFGNTDTDVIIDANFAAEAPNNNRTNECTMIVSETWAAFTAGNSGQRAQIAIDRDYQGTNPEAADVWMKSGTGTEVKVTKAGNIYVDLGQDPS